MTTPRRRRDGKLGTEVLGLLPLETTLRDSRKVVVDIFRSDAEYDAAFELTNCAIEDGDALARIEVFEDVVEWRQWFCSHAAFVVRATEEGFDCDGAVSKRGSILGAFFCRPKFQGRGAHLCETFLVSAPEFRRLGVGRLMGSCFLRFARDLGYGAAYVDQVFQSNDAIVHLLESLGFQRACELPNALRLNPALIEDEALRRGDDESEDDACPDYDTAVAFFYDLNTDLPEDFDPLACSNQRDSILFAAS